MDIAELVEAEKRREQAIENERQKRKLEYQLRCLDTERRKWSRQMDYKITRTSQTLNFLHTEKDREIDNYLATQSETTEQKYKDEEATVRNLVASTDHIKAVLKHEKEDLARVSHEIWELENETSNVKKEIGARNLADSHTRLPCERKMNNRVEVASVRFHEQLLRNRELEAKLDELLFVRARDQEVALKLQKKLDSLNEVITNAMHETGTLYEERERVEATKTKLRAHIQKVTNRYERDLLTLVLNSSDEKKTDTFMRTKHKEITQKLIQQRKDDLLKAEDMVAQTDEWQLQFRNIRVATGEKDIDVVVDKFKENEDNNFGTFIAIGSLLRENEDLRRKVRELRGENVDMEDQNLDFMGHISNTLKEVEISIDTYKQRSESCIGRLATSSKKLNMYYKEMKQLIDVLKLSAWELKDTLGPSGVIQDTNVLGCMAVIENAVAILLQDYYMLELTVRAKSLHKVQEPEGPNEDCLMMTRKPSARIEIYRPKKHSKFPDDKEEVNCLKTAALQTTENIKDLLIQEMLQEEVSTSASNYGTSQH